MKSLIRTLAMTTVLTALPLAANADTWTISGDESKIAFGSIKKDTVGEVHHFSGISGQVGDDGAVMVEIDLTTVETYIDIRNERMVKMVFGKDTPKATIKASLDAGELEKLEIGQTTTVDVEGTLTLGKTNVPVETSMFVARLGEDRAVVTTDEMIMLSTADAGIDDAVSKLMEVAKLPGITRVSPVTMRLVFDRGGDAVMAKADTEAKAEEPKEEAKAATAAATTAVAAITGDVKKGAKVFKRCKACHVVGSEKNRVGPHLNGVIGRTAGSVDGFKYSKAMKGAGIDWTVENLTAYLANPKKFMPGNKMAFAGLRKESQISDVIAYIDAESK